MKEEKKKEEEEEKKVLPRFQQNRYGKQPSLCPAHHYCLARFSVRILISERIREYTIAPTAVSYLLAT